MPNAKELLDLKAEEALAQAQRNADLKSEYVAGGSGDGVHRVVFGVTSLPKTADDIENEVDTEAYRKMLNDPAVWSCLAILIRMILAAPLRVVPAITDEKDPQYPRALEMAKFVEDCFSNRWSRRPFVSVLDEMMNVLWQGYSIAEIVLRLEDRGKHKGKLVLEAVKPKSRDEVSFLVDEFYNVVGLTYTQPSTASKYAANLPTWQGRALLPREKFLVMSLFGRGSDPRGRSVLRPAYNSWYFRQQTFVPWLKYLDQWANPSLVGITPETPMEMGTPDLDSSGAIQANSDGTVKMLTPEEVLKNALLEFRGGSVIALRGGSSLEALKSDGDGQAFKIALDHMAREIALAILGTTRTNSEAEHGSKADSETSADVVSLIANYYRKLIEAALDADLVRLLIETNFGYEALDYAPFCKIDEADAPDIAALGDVIAKLFSGGYLHSSQIPEVDALLGLPPRNVEAWLNEMEEAKDREAQAMGELDRLMTPRAGAEDEDAGEDEDE